MTGMIEPICKIKGVDSVITEKTEKSGVLCPDPACVSDDAIGLKLVYTPVGTNEELIYEPVYCPKCGYWSPEDEADNAPA